MKAWWVEESGIRKERLTLNTDLVEYVGEEERVEYGGGTVSLWPVYLVSGKRFLVDASAADRVVKGIARR